MGDDPDTALVEQALAVAERARIEAPPNPWVGSVVTDAAGLVVGEGSTAPAGGAHAEVAALVAAGERARGGTLAVTLEPCDHHGRTGPCTEAILAAGVRRVVVGISDPDERVAGRGLARLRAGGVDVRVGVLGDAVARQLAPYLHHRRTGRAACVLKTAVTLDGRTAAADGSSRWITGPEARADAHRVRAESQAVVVGAVTARSDRPTLTVRDVEPRPARQPLRVVLDARGIVPAVGPLFDASLAPTLVVTTEAADPAAVDAWRAAGAKVEVVEPAPGGVDLRATLGVLGAHGVLQALVEGGATLHGAILEAGLADRIVAYVGAAVLGTRGRPALELAGPETIGGATRLALLAVTRLGDDVRLDYEPSCSPG